MKNKQKSAAIYDRWLSTLGGGEQVVFAYAETLTELGYKVDIITHEAFDTKKAEKKMGVSLEKINVLYVEPKSSKELSQYSEKYDLFINSSYLDYFSNRSKNGFLNIFFPSEIYLSPFEFIKRALVIPSFRSFFIYPLNYEKFTYDEYKKGKIFKWLGNDSSIVFKKNVDKVKISLYTDTFYFSLFEQIVFLLNDKQIQPSKKTLNHNINEISYDFSLHSSKKNNRLTIKLPDDCPEKIALTKLTIPSFRFFLYNIFKNYFPKWEMRLHGGPGVTKRSDLESYKKIITISEFCKKWITKYWGLDSEILYPPVNTKAFSISKNKKNQIIHVGRFFVTGHSKKQLDLIKIFKKIVDEKKSKGWELHFVGSVHEGEEHQNYFDACIKEAEGYPIQFHVNIPFEELKELLSESKIYWHATGLDQDEEQNPILFEHFGITTVEAMASGCVPIVINAAGQREIVTDKSGFRWNNRNEITDYTIKLINDETLLNKYKSEAIKRSKYFSRENFKKRFEKIIT
jgi:glycosyltransferase involved in cell wall biosynthesis